MRLIKKKVGSFLVSSLDGQGAGQVVMKGIFLRKAKDCFQT